MVKLRQISIDFNYKQGQCGVCGKDGLVVEVGSETKISICADCASEIDGVHNNMKLMKTAN